MAHHVLSLPLATILAVALLLARRAAGYPWYVCGSSSNFAANSTYQDHLDFVTATLPKNASSSPDLFATAVVGTIPEQLWAMGLCRGDVNASTCFECLTQGFQVVPNDCPYDKGASIYYDPCMVHYSDVHTLPNDDTGPMMNTYVVTNDGNVTSADAARFKSLLADLINATVEYAANSSRRFATGEADFNQETIPKVYSVAQCTPDQTPAQCHKCLDRMVEATLEAFNGSIGGRVLGVDCTYRYETAPFYNGRAMVRVAPPTSSRAPAPAPALQPTAAGGEPMYYTEAEDTEMVDSMMMDVSTLRAATGDFDESNKLGEGGFGAVYKVALTNTGYMAPEYMMRGTYSVKSDAFSFGVMLLEIVTGRKNNNDGCNLLTTVWMHWEAGTVAELVEPSMGGSFPEGDVLRCVHIGLLCVQADPAARPVMSSVVMMLGSDTVTLQAPSKPGFFARNNNANTAVSTVSLSG
ncbi:unnamed protein product [Miscanthus lutarioriparius]|uniref:Gnk2-homologous domain-containing protein n=1 Tax=Miscanthus lutarioriparius TaxID=422564 RepID=A0A811NJG3_9POAL|nr:unnamed protein product [Miscanthus lutarioriparius]